MKQFDVDDSKKVEVDYSDPELPESVRTFKPLVFLDDSAGEQNAYCVVLGPDPQVGIFGCGATPGEALWDWDKHLAEFRNNHDEDDEVAIYIDEVLSNTVEEKIREKADDDDVPFETPHVKGLS